MSDEVAFLKAIAAHPADDLVREVFCDFLEGEARDAPGNPERAEFVRSQIHRARTICSVCADTRVLLGSAGDRTNPPCPDCTPALSRETFLLAEWGEKWFPGPCGSTFYTASNSWYVVRTHRSPSGATGGAATRPTEIAVKFRRGFPHEVHVASIELFDGVTCSQCRGTGLNNLGTYDPASDEVRGAYTRPCGMCDSTRRTFRVGKQLVEMYPLGRVVVGDRAPRRWNLRGGDDGEDDWIWTWRRDMGDFPEVALTQRAADDRRLREEGIVFTGDRLPPDVFDALSLGEPGGLYFVVLSLGEPGGLYFVVLSLGEPGGLYLVVGKYSDRRYVRLGDATKDLSDVLLARAKT